MNIYLKARIRKIIVEPALSDRRALYFDGVKISINEQTKIETDSTYVPHPRVPAELIEYYKDFELAKDVCESCLITRTINELTLISENHILNKNLQTNKVTQKNNLQTKTQRRLLREISKMNADKTFYYHERLRLSLDDPLLSDRYYVSINSGINYALLMKLENDNKLIPRFETSNSLLRVYKDSEFAKQICMNCPVHKSLKKIEREVKENNMEQQRNIGGSKNDQRAY